MNSAAAELFGASIMSRELVKEVLKELFREEPELLQEALQGMLSELTEELLHMQKEQAIDKKHISDIELLLGLDEDLQDPTQPYYQEKKKRMEELQEISSLPQTGEGPDERLYNELRKRQSMQTKEVMGVCRCRHYQQARRIMEKISERPDVIMEQNKHGKGYRIRMKKRM